MLFLAVISFAAKAQTDNPVSAADTVKTVTAPVTPADDTMVLFDEGAGAVQAADPSETVQEPSGEAAPLDPKVIGLYRHLDGMRLNGMDLTKEQQMDILAELSALDGEDYVSQWEKYRKGRGVGVGLIIGGSSLAAAGGAVIIGAGLVYVVCAIFVVLGGQEAIDNLTRLFTPWFISGAVAVGAGAAVAIAGIPITKTNCNKMSTITNRYNQVRNSPAMVLTFGQTRSGIGLALNF